MVHEVSHKVSRNRRFTKYNHSVRHSKIVRKVSPSYHVVNLSSHTLTNGELSVLNRGLNFVPTPPPPKPPSLQRDTNNLARTLRLGLQFRNKRRLPTPFRQKSSYNPPVSTNPRVENYIHALKVGMAKLHPQKTVPQNLSIRQHQALGNLSRNSDLVIKKADKGSTIVVLNKQDYIDKGLVHLSDQELLQLQDMDVEYKLKTCISLVSGDRADAP